MQIHSKVGSLNRVLLDAAPFTRDGCLGKANTQQFIGTNTRFARSVEFWPYAALLKLLYLCFSSLKAETLWPYHLFPEWISRPSFMVIILFSPHTYIG